MVPRESRMIDLLIFLTVLSANLAVLNALPIPPLDGSRALMAVVQRVPEARLLTGGLLLAAAGAAGLAAGEELELDGGASTVDDQNLHAPQLLWAWTAVMATVFTMSRTVVPRERSLTGLRSPCITGPTAMARALRCTAL